MSPTGAAIIPDALSTGLPQCQSESTISVTAGLSGVQTRSGGDLIDRHRTFPGGWGVNRDKRYLRERTREIAKCPRRAGAPPRSSQPAVDDPRVDLRDMRVVPIYSTAGHMLFGKTYHSATASNSAMGM
jgi:hypothetical protein